MEVHGTRGPYSRTMFVSNVGKRKERAGRFSQTQEESKLHKKVPLMEIKSNARLEAVKERLQRKLEKRQEEKDVNSVEVISQLALVATILRSSN